MSTIKERLIQEKRRDNLLSLCEIVKSVRYDNEQSVRDFYFYCLRERNNGNYYALDCFKKWFPVKFYEMQSILNKRTLIKRDLEIMKAVSNRVVFGALTFSDSNYLDNETNMKRKAQRYLDKCLSAYEIIEEHGEEKGRYHVHYLGILQEGLTYIDFHNGWEDYTYIEAVKNSKKDIKKVSKYLCDYVVKQVPRIRRNKLLLKVINLYKEHERLLLKDVMSASVKWLEIQKVLDVQEDLPF